MHATKLSSLLAATILSSFCFSPTLAAARAIAGPYIPPIEEPAPVPAPIQHVFYVDASNGNDANDGTSIKTPWKTVAKVNATSFQPGDTILFKRGNTWREQLMLNSAGSANAPITIGAYTSVVANAKTVSRTTAAAVSLANAKPVISGADLITAPWQASTLQQSPNIYVAHIGAVNQPNQLYVDDDFYDIAHYPNNSFLTSTGQAADQRSLIDANMNFTREQLVGATLITKSMPWTLDPAGIADFDPATHTFTTSNDIRYTMSPNFGYYLRNKLWMLDSPGEWYYDAQKGDLYIWLKNNENPANHRIEIAQRDFGIHAERKGNIVVKDLKVTYAQYTDIDIAGESNLTVDNVDTLGGRVGVNFGSDNSTLSNSTINGATVIGVNAWGSGMVVSGNSVNNVGNLGFTPDQTPVSVGISGNNNVFRNNSVTNSAYNAVNFGGNKHLIQGNTVDHSCLKLADCAAIYSWEGDPANTDAGTIIENNTVSNSIGNLIGTPYTSGSQAHAIYLDDRVHDVTVRNNVTSNSELGIFIHNGYNDVISGNRILGTRSGAIFIMQDTGSGHQGFVHDNTVTNNYFQSLSTDQVTAYLDFYDHGDSSKFGISDNNRFCHPNTANVALLNDNNVRNGFFTLPAWREATGRDLHSVDLPASCIGAKDVRNPIPVVPLTPAEPPVITLPPRLPIAEPAPVPQPGPIKVDPIIITTPDEPGEAPVVTIPPRLPIAEPEPVEPVAPIKVGPVTDAASTAEKAKARSTKTAQ